MVDLSQYGPGELADSVFCGFGGFSFYYVYDGFGLCQIHTIVEKSATCEFTGLCLTSSGAE
jgi:hypothetical protein